MKPAKTNIFTGTHINYYHVCERKLWLFHHGISMEHKSDLVALGRLLHEESYARNQKEIPFLENIKIDRITADGVIHEIKKSNKLENAHVWQLKYYLFVLKEQGVWPLSGVLEYPKLRTRLAVDLSSEDEVKIEEMLTRIAAVICNATPPCAHKMKICRKCAYFEYCFG